MDLEFEAGLALTYKEEQIPVKQNGPYLDLYIDQVRGSIIRIRVRTV